MRLPLVYHPAYSCAWPSNHRFPMWKFADLHAHLSSIGLATPENTHRPREDPPHEWFTAVHDPDYYHAFLDGALGEHREEDERERGPRALLVLVAALRFCDHLAREHRRYRGAHPSSRVALCAEGDDRREDEAADVDLPLLHLDGGHCGGWKIAARTPKMLRFSELCDAGDAGTAAGVWAVRG